MFPRNFMLFCSLIEELCTKEECDKTGCNFNSGHECSSRALSLKRNNPLYQTICTKMCQLAVSLIKIVFEF